MRSAGLPASEPRRPTASDEQVSEERLKARMCEISRHLCQRRAPWAAHSAAKRARGWAGSRTGRSMPPEHALSLRQQEKGLDFRVPLVAQLTVVAAASRLESDAKLERLFKHIMMKRKIF